MSTLKEKQYQHGFTTQIDMESFAKGLTEEVIYKISKKKKEPQWMLDYRLKAFSHWKTLKEPHWGSNKYEKLDYQDVIYYAAPKDIEKKKKNYEDLDPELIKTFERLGIPLNEQKRISGVAVDAVFDSVSIATTHNEVLDKVGVIFCSISEAIVKHEQLVKKYLGTVVPYTDNYFATLNAAVFTDGSFCYIPKNVKCPLDLSTYFRINMQETGQFERTLLIADQGSFVNYLEGCTAPMNDKNQLHAAVVELVALDNAIIKYSTVQNWYPGDKKGKGGIYNFVTKRGQCRGKNSQISWTQVETGSAITWKYPSCVLTGENSQGFFYSVALTHDYMQADTGTKMIHIGKNTKSVIISKGISSDNSINTYRGIVQVLPSAEGAKNYSQCDSMLVGTSSQAHTYPMMDIKNNTAVIEHEASTSKISQDQLYYLQSRGLSAEQSISLIVNGFCKDVFKHLPLEFSEEAVSLVEMKLENSIG